MTRLLYGSGLVGAMAVLYMLHDGSSNLLVVAFSVSLLCGCIGLLLKEHAARGGTIPFAENASRLLRQQRVLMGYEKTFKPSLLAARVHTHAWGMWKSDKMLGQTSGELGVGLNEFWKRETGHDYPFARPRHYEQDATRLSATVHGYECTVMSSSSYCGVVAQTSVLKSALRDAEAAGPNLGSAAALGINSVLVKCCESLKKYYKRQEAMVYSAGFLACEDIIRILVRQSPGRTLVLMDAKSHPCIRNGAVFAEKYMTFKHNDAEDLRRLLRQHRSKYDQVLVCMESIYSTDGKLGDLPQISRAAKDYDCLLIVDDAHGFGVLGPNCGGVEEYWNMVGASDIICGTLSKATSTQGGFVVMNSAAIFHALIGSDGVGFAANLNSFNAGYCSAAIEYIMNNGVKIQKNGTELKKYFTEQLSKKLAIHVPPSPARVFSIKFDHPVLAVMVQEKLLPRGYFVSAFCFPACPAKISIIRITIIPGIYTNAIIDDFIYQLGEATKEATVACKPYDHGAWIFQEPTKA